ncbi:MAG TPA: hypothetical protein VNA17_09900, partial [Pyrinomonadaceae bacterium]|nr:hypothetical protein [Pyrinomonadaceae bacterium]
IVDSFLSKKLADAPPVETSPPGDPVKTVIHEIKSEVLAQNGAPPKAVDFVSEDDVRRAINKGEKIYISKKTILTPSARDLGDEKEVFATV